jgi:hypothetical protein
MKTYRYVYGKKIQFHNIIICSAIYNIIQRPVKRITGPSYIFKEGWHFGFPLLCRVCNTICVQALTGTTSEFKELF